MKKLLGAVMALLFAGSAFALNFSADVNFTVPMNAWYNEWTQVGNYKRNNLDYGFGFDVGGQMMVTNQFGARAAFGLSFPKACNYSQTYTLGSSTVNDSGTTQYNSSNTSVTELDLFVGPVINVKSAKNYVIYVNPGFSMLTRFTTTKSGDSSSTATVIDWGIGAEIDARYNVTKNLYARASLPIVWTFSSVDKASGTEKSVNKLHFTPHLGLGYKF